MMSFFRALAELLQLVAAHLERRKQKERKLDYEEAENNPAEHFANKFGGMRSDSATKTSDTRSECDRD